MKIINLMIKSVFSKLKGKIQLNRSLKFNLIYKLRFESF